VSRWSSSPPPPTPHLPETVRADSYETLFLLDCSITCVSIRWNNLSPTSWKHLPFGTVLTSSAADLSTHLHIMFGVAITPPTLVEPEASLRGRPVQSASNKSQRKTVMLCYCVMLLFPYFFFFMIVSPKKRGY
jgi:hypothetical protein